MRETLIGFDLRTPIDDALAASWNSKQREEFLLKPSIHAPISVDPSIWPSLLPIESIVMPPSAGVLAQPSREVFKGEQTAFGLWRSSEDVRRWWFGASNNKRQGRLIAISLVDQPFLPDDGWIRNALDPQLLPSEELEASRYMNVGFDVADRSLISSVCNCGFVRLGRETLAKEWSNSVNEFGLFSEFADALKFRELSDAVIEEHAPFYVLSLWVNQEVLTSGTCAPAIVR